MFSSKQCPYCCKVFSRSFNLRRHLENNSCKMTDNMDSYAVESSTEDDCSNVGSSHDISADDDNSESDSSSESEPDTESESDDSEHPWYWQSLIDEAIAEHEEERREIVEKLQSDGATEENAKQIAYNRMLPIVRKELRNILTEKLEWLHAMKRDFYFQKIMKTRNELLDTGDYEWLEATKLAIHQRKFLLNDLIIPQYLEDNSKESNETDSME